MYFAANGSCGRTSRTGRRSIAALHDEIASDEAELERIADRQERQAAEADAAQRAMGDQRWADPAADDDQEQR